MKLVKSISKLCLATVVTGIAVLTSCQAQPEKQPNVIIILADDMSPHLSMLGTPGIQTPHIDALAKEGVYFEHAFSASASCSPSRTAILTGMWPHSSGTWRNVFTPPLDMPDKEFSRQTHFVDNVGIGTDVATLPEVFQANGYFTGITQKLHLSPAWRYPFDARNPVQSTPARFEKVIGSFIDQAGDKPFFILANVAAPHRPYKAHLKNNPNQKLPAADRIEIPRFLPDVPAVRKDMQEYYASVEIADACVGAILKALDTAGVRDNTLVIFTADQGMPIHHAKASGYPGGMRIPLIVVGPGVEVGKRNLSPVSQIDYAPTALEFSGIEIPEVMQGLSLWPALKREGTLMGRDYVFAEHNSHGPDPRQFFPQRVATDGEWYYILNVNPTKIQLLPFDLRSSNEQWGNHAHAAIIAAKETHPDELAFLTQFSKPRAEEHLYDLKNDPWGVKDLANDERSQKILKKFRKAVAEWREETDDIEKSPLEIPVHGDRMDSSTVIYPLND